MFFFIFVNILCKRIQQSNSAYLKKTRPKSVEMAHYKPTKNPPDNARRIRNTYKQVDWFIKSNNCIGSVNHASFILFAAMAYAL